MSYVSVEQVIDLAIAGAGVGLVNSLLVTKEMATGQLVRPLPHEARLEGYVFLYPSAGLKTEARAFRQWLLNKLNGSDL
jgi:LysR family glycine cleavage system transcriptional activator